MKNDMDTFPVPVDWRLEYLSLIEILFVHVIIAILTLHNMAHAIVGFM